MDTGSPISLDLGFAVANEQNSKEKGASSPSLAESPNKYPINTLANTVGVPVPDSNTVDSIFDRDVTDQWSPTQDNGHRRNDSTTSVTFEASDNIYDKRSFDEDRLPAWSELKTKAGKERKRLPLACIDCRRKKIKCSGEKPACKHCVKARVPCVYKNAARKAAPRTDYMAMLDKRLKRMEDRVIKMIPKEDMPDLGVTGRSSVRPPIPGQSTKKEKAPVIKRTAEDAFTAELNEWTQPRKSTGPEIGTNGRNQREFENRLNIEGADVLPPAPIQEHLSELFFDCVYGQSYLLLHKPSFMRKLKAGNVPPVLVLAVCAISARFSTHPQVNTEPSFMRGEQWATTARKIVEKRHFEPNITILTVMIILGLHYFGTCEGGLSWSFGGQAMRMGYALQLHRELDHDPLGKAQADREITNENTMPLVPELSFTDREIRRRLMWACYMMDIFNSSGTERPSFLNEKYFAIQLPIKEANFQQETPGLTEDIEGNVTLPKGLKTTSEDVLSEARGNLGVAAYVLRAVVIWKRIVQYLNLGGKEKDPHPIWDPLSQFASLQRQIQKLKAGLPETLQYTPENLAVHVSERLANQFLFLHIVLAQTSLFLHRFAIPTAPNTHRPYPPNTPKPFLATCATTVVEAASLVSKILADSTGQTLTVPFAGYCAYTAGTVHVWGIFSKHLALEISSKESLRHNYRYLMRMKRYWGMFHYMAESIKDIYRAFAEADNSSKTDGRGLRSLSSKSTAFQDSDKALPPSTSTAIDSLISADPSRAPSPSAALEEHQSISKEDTTRSERQHSTGSKHTEGPSPTAHSSSKQPILQYGDWFNKYPHGVSEHDWENKHHPHKGDARKGNEAVMSQKSELQSVEEFFASLSPPSKAVAADRARDAAAAASAASTTTWGRPEGSSQKQHQQQKQEDDGRAKKIARRRGKSVVENFGSGGVAAGLTKGNSGGINAQSNLEQNQGHEADLSGEPKKRLQHQHQNQLQNQLQLQLQHQLQQQQNRPRQQNQSHLAPTSAPSTNQKPQQRTQRLGSGTAQNQSPGPSARGQLTDMSTTSSSFNASGLDLNASDIDIPMADFMSNNPQQRLQSQAGTTFDINTTNSPSYFNSSFPSGFTPTAHRPSLDFEYNSPSTASNPGSSTNPQAQGPGHMNFNFNYTSALPHLDRQMVFGAYAGLDPSTTSNSSALNNPNNLDFWGDPWNTVTSNGNVVGESVDMDGFNGFDDLGLTDMSAGMIEGKNAELISGSVHSNIRSTPNTTGAHAGSGYSGGDNNFGLGPGRPSGAAAADMSSSAWFMPFNIEPPIFPGFEDYSSFDAMDMSGNGIGFGVDDDGSTQPEI